MATVLVVDDDKELRESLRIVLEDVGYAALEAANGRDAPEMPRASLYPLVSHGGAGGPAHALHCFMAAPAHLTR